MPAIFELVKNTELRVAVYESWIMRIAAAYVLVHIVSLLLGASDTDAAAYGLAINLRIVGMFFISYILFSAVKIPKSILLTAILVPSILVVVVGLLQMFVLPHNAFSWFGYEKGVTIAESMNIDEQPDEIRIMSTLRGPNPLGAYLILPGVLLAALLSRIIFNRRHWDKVSRTEIGFMALAFVGLLITLYGTHGRASWISFVAALGLLLLIILPAKVRTFLLLLGVVTAVAAGLLGYTHRESAFVQTVILHDNPETGGEITSNDAHITATTDGIKDIAEKPFFGCSPGCAGPASFYHEDGARIAENYYVQIGQEVGVVGVFLFMAMTVLVGAALWRQRSDPLSVVLFASLVGLSLANVLLHVWADDTLAYVWWGAAGAALASPLIHTKVRTAS